MGLTAVKAASSYHRILRSGLAQCSGARGRSTDHWIDPSRGERNHPRPHSTEARGIWLSSVELGPVRVDVGKTPVNRPTDRSAWRTVITTPIGTPGISAGVDFG